MLNLTHFFSKLQNAALQQKVIVHFPYSQLCYEVANLLKTEGFLKRVEHTMHKKQKTLWVVLKLKKNNALIRKIQQYSTCGRSIFWQLSDFPTGGFYVLSTSKGILSKKDAFQAQVGGQVLCRIL